ncbi:MAG: hypothetical protein H6668_08660 [Ardenticatenaceae bacterium]|nr:hypothetical protein [Ardenticatenaceae bacterium]
MTDKSLPGYEEGFLQGGDDDFCTGVEFLGEVGGVFVFIDLGDDACFVLDLVDAVLELFCREFSPVRK